MIDISGLSREEKLELMERLWDDLAKVAGAPTPPLAHYVAVLESAQR